MAKIEQFEDVEAWQLARQLANRVYDFTDGQSFSRDFALRDQIRRAAISVMSNIAEGFESQNDKTFVRYLYIAKASAGEVRAQLFWRETEPTLTQMSFPPATSWRPVPAR